MITVNDIVKELESFAPPAYQESYDNSGLLVGFRNTSVTGALVCLDITEAVIDEAIEKNCNFIVCHHPIVFSGLKRFNGNNMVERCVMTAIKNDIAIYASHTNMDSVQGGVNDRICQKLGLQNLSVLSPTQNHLIKLVVFVPESIAESVREALFSAGAGAIGNYSSCSFNSIGEGTFKASDGCNPHVGSIGEVHYEKEVRLEVVLPKHIKGKVVGAMLKAHPYEEVAYDLLTLQNEMDTVGLGRVGELKNPMTEKDFLSFVTSEFKCQVIRHTDLTGKEIKRVALCGGAGSSLLQNAIGAQADVYVSGDFKYHDFFEAEARILVADIGHYESEQYTKEVFYEILTKKFPNFAVHLTGIDTNPVKYFK